MTGPNRTGSPVLGGRGVHPVPDFQSGSAGLPAAPVFTNSLLDRRYLLVGPRAYPWDLASNLSGLLQTPGVDHRVFSWLEYPTPEAANASLLELVRAYRPDVLFGLKLDAISPETLRAIRQAGVFVLLWYMDCFTPEVPAWLRPLLQQVDLFLTTARGMLPHYREHTAAPCFWVMEGAYLPAYPPVAPAPSQDRVYGSQVAFVGNLFQPPVDYPALLLRRFDLFDRIGRRFALRVWGPQSPAYRRVLMSRERSFRVTEWPAYNEELVKVCRASSIVLGINTVNSVERYFSNRTFITLAAGGFHLTHYVPGLERMFENHKHLVWFHSEEECLDLIAHYLDRPEARARIAALGRAHVRRRYSMRRQIQRILELVGRYDGRG